MVHKCSYCDRNIEEGRGLFIETNGYVAVGKVDTGNSTSIMGTHFLCDEDCLLNLLRLNTEYR